MHTVSFIVYMTVWLTLLCVLFDFYWIYIKICGESVPSRPDKTEKIYKNKTSDNVFICGNTNAGKSTLINKFIKSYSNNDFEITTSILPSTTININEIKIDENELIDWKPQVSSFIITTSQNTAKNWIYKYICFEIMLNQECY